MVRRAQDKKTISKMKSKIKLCSKAVPKAENGILLTTLKSKIKPLSTWCLMFTPSVGWLTHVMDSPMFYCVS